MTIWSLDLIDLGCDSPKSVCERLDGGYLM